MIQYVRRFIKFLLYAVFFLILLLIILPLIAEGKTVSESFQELFRQKQTIIIIALLLAYSLLYPVIGFRKVKRYINGRFDDNKVYFDEAFQGLDYIKKRESDSEIVYRKKSFPTRALYLWEDEVKLDTYDNPVIISGMRKATTRINRRIEQSMIKDQTL
ncbi:MAG: hypothetical protein JXB19_11740 [Bacteroidales bacterium]|nr:hypothetical protein [Bacteroidales bacterium]